MTPLVPVIKLLGVTFSTLAKEGVNVVVFQKVLNTVTAARWMGENWVVMSCARRTYLGNRKLCVLGRTSVVNGKYLLKNAEVSVVVQIYGGCGSSSSSMSICSLWTCQNLPNCEKSESILFFFF